MKKFFGTDGIRGVAGQFPLDRTTVFAIGLALGEEMRARGQQAVVIGEDTRESSRWIAATLVQALHRHHVRVEHAGVITTPGIAFLTSGAGIDAGVMISASHNPYQDNGIKIFDHSGYKLPDAEEAAIEQRLEQLLAAGLQAPEIDNTAVVVNHQLRERYLNYLLAAVDHAGFSRLRLVVDCGNGAASALAGDLFQRLGALAEVIHARPDGRNINLGCGALHVETLGEYVVKSGADAGLALDGDADRAILVDAHGHVINGDLIMLAAARELRAQGQLQPATVVGTVMSNLGLQVALSAAGISLERAPVGDKYVLERMLATGALLGGEQSGHVIFRGYATTGDGLLTGLKIFEIMARRGQSLAELVAGFRAFPQQIVNVKVKEKLPLETLPTVVAAIAAAERRFGDRGRVLVRYSGTEKLARVMVEGESEQAVAQEAQTIADALRASLGA